MNLPALPPESTSFRAKDHLGCQIWIERDDSAARIDQLFARAAECGLGLARIFLMWPWIEEKPGQWDFRVWDDAFDAAQRHGIKIKATFTANSPVWHVGPESQGGILHSHNGFLGLEQREPMRRYVVECVRRYAKHPALGQWILWNEPYGGHERTDETLQHWRAWLRKAYSDDLEKLNRRWMAGYAGFDEIPFPEQVTHNIHRGNAWACYGPMLEDWKCRAAWLISEIRWLRDVVRTVDADTPTCVNPAGCLGNRAADGTDLLEMGGTVETMGASYHPAWHFTFAQREDFPALMAAGVRLQAAVPSIRRVEVTEVQCGNTLNSSTRPSDATPGELARFVLAGFAAGAESVTGWLLNVRSQDFEAGDWGLLDNRDKHSARSRMMRRLHDRLEFAFEKTGAWCPAPAQFWIAHEPRSQAIEWIEAKFGEVPGREGQDGARGANLLAVAAMQCGFAPALASLEHMPKKAGVNGEVLVLSHVVAWEKEDGRALADFVESGGTLLLDATCGRKTFDAAIHRPWPGGLAERAGFEAIGLSTRPEGWEIAMDGVSSGRWLLARLDVEFDPAAGWHAWPELRYALDGEPCVWERKLGNGRVVIARGLLGPSLVHVPSSFSAARLILRRLSGIVPAVFPVSGHPNAFAVPIQVEKGSLTAIFAPERFARGGRPLRVWAPRGTCVDLWSGETVETGADSETVLEAPEGVALLWREQLGNHC